jgi:hypothetical protein
MLVAAALLLVAQAAGDPALVAVGERGRLLYAYDQAAWHGTDDLMANHRDVVPKQGGYVVDGSVDDPRIVFFDTATRRAVYVAHVREGKVVDATVPAGVEAELAPLDRTLIAAREAAVAAMRADATARPCAAKPFNTVVVPPSAPEGPISVYFLTPQTTTDAVPMGGHYRVDVDASGTAGAVQRFTRTCLSIIRPRLPAGSKPEGAFVTQLIGDRPTGIHVFASYTLRLPVFVGVGQPPNVAMWTVNGARIAGPMVPPKR